MWLRRDKSISVLISTIFLLLLTHGIVQAATVRFVDKEGNTLAEVEYTLYQQAIYIPVEELNAIFKSDISPLYNRPRKQLTIKLNERELVLLMGRNTVKVPEDNQTLTLSLPPRAIDGKPMLPIIFFTEILPSIDDVEVLYNPNLQRIRFMPKTAWIPDPDDETQEWTIVIDPGHGGQEDIGCKAQSGLLEKDVVLNVAREIQKLSKQYGYKIHLTRESDVEKTRIQRVQSSNRIRGNLFLSLHCNASFSKKQNGMHIFINNPNGMLRFRTLAMPTFGKNKLNLRTQSNFLTQSKEFGTILQKEMNFMTEKPIPISELPLIALDEIYMPAILLELGYLTNNDDASLLADHNHIKELATAIARALHTYTMKSSQSSDMTDAVQEE